MNSYDFHGSFTCKITINYDYKTRLMKFYCVAKKINYNQKNMEKTKSKLVPCVSGGVS